MLRSCPNCVISINSFNLCDKDLKCCLIDKVLRVKKNMYSFLPFPRAICTRHVVFIESNLFVGLLTVSSRIHVVNFFF